jgi:hypothetical protein
MKNEILLLTKDFLIAIETLMPEKLTRSNKKSNSELKVFFRLVENNLEISTLYSKAILPIANGDWDEYVSFEFKFLMSLIKFPPTNEQIKILYADKKIKIDTLIFPASLTKTKRF